MFPRSAEKPFSDMPRPRIPRKDDPMYIQPSPEKIQRINRRLAGLMSTAPSETDPQGMYTGVPDDPYEKPVQDADDL